MTDLFLSSFAPTLGSGRALRTYTCVRALAMLGPVEFAYVPLGGHGPSAEYQGIDGLTFTEITPSRGARRARTYASQRARGVPAAWARGISPELVDAAAQLVPAAGRTSGRVVAGDLSCAAALLRLAPRRSFVYNAHNVESSYRHDDHNQRVWSRIAVKRFERRLLAAASESWMVSRADMAAASALEPSARLRYAPNVVDVDAIAPVVPSPPARTVLMLGDFGYAPNRSGLDFLVREVMPRVWAVRPDARLRLVGRQLDDIGPTDERVDVLGFVPHVTDAYADADCVAVPLVQGGGTPLKFVEALAYGVPVVATPLAAKGLEVQPGVHYREGAGAEGFARAVLEVLERGGDEQARNGRHLAEQEYSVPALARRLAA